MAMTDADRPGDEVEPEEFGDSEAIDGNGEEGEFAADIGDEPDRLELGDEDTSLPWLDGDDDLDNDEAGGGGQIVLLSLLALSALALIIGGIWWFTRGQAEEELVADGSVIEAPAEPYKEKPEDPGGKTFEGTGDTSYAVSEGETRTAQLGDGSDAKDAPKPGFESVGPGSVAAKPAASAGKTPSSGTGSLVTPPSTSAGPGVQVGAYSNRAAAEAGWGRLAAAHSSLSGLKYRVVEGKADIGTVYRLQALPGDAAAARALCAKLKAAGQDCAIKD